MSYIRKAQSDDERQMEYFIKAIRSVVREEVAAALNDHFDAMGDEGVKKSAGWQGDGLVDSFA